MAVEIKDILAVLPGDGKSFAPRRSSVYIAEGKISAIGKAPDGFSADRVIDGRGKLLIHGLVNTHAHAYMTGFRNWADDLPFDKWLFEKIMPKEDEITPEDAYWFTLLAQMEMLRGGVTSYLDMHMFPGVVPRAATEMGMHCTVSRGLSGGADDMSGGERRLREALAEIDEYGESENLVFMLAPHSPYTCDEGYLREVAAESRRKNLGIHTHLAESAAETDIVMQRYGISPTEFMDRCGLLFNKTVAAHCVRVSQNDIAILAERGVSVSLNLSSNLKLANGFPPYLDMLKAGINLCLGTDSAASNNSLSVLREMFLAAVVQKGLSGDPCAVEASDVLRMATENGARAIGFPDCGVIREGAAADLAIFDLQKPELTPLGNPVNALAYSFSGQNPEVVLCSGKIVYEKGEFKTVDAGRVMFETAAACKRLGIL